MFTSRLVTQERSETAVLLLSPVQLWLQSQLCSTFLFHLDPSYTHPKCKRCIGIVGMKGLQSQL